MNESGKIRVIIVDDSAVFRGFWGRIVGAQPDMEVVTTAVDGISAISTVKLHEVDVVLLDIEMPRMTGLEALPSILKEKPGVKVIIASALTREGSKTAIEALSLGASDFVAKPSGLQQNQPLEELTNDLLAKIRVLGTPKKPRSSAPASSNSAQPKAGLQKTASPPKLLIIGTSTGGPSALSVVLKGLSSNFTLPILIVQHMPPEFTRMLAERLGKDTGRVSKEGSDGEPVLPGRIYVGPGDFHMEAERDAADNWKLRLNQEPHEHFCRPSVDRLFNSVAKHCRGDVLSVILTGMGEDGLLGIEKVRKAGGLVIAQDEASSVVWGMPGAVVKAGLAHYVCPLTDVPAQIERLANEQR